MANRRGMVTGAKLERIGEALREVLGTSIYYTIDEMPDAIRRAKGEPSEALMGIKIPVFERERLILTDYTLL